MTDSGHDPDVSRLPPASARFANRRNWSFAGRSAEICQLDWGSE